MMVNEAEIGAKRLWNWIYFVIALPFILCIPAGLLDIPLPLYCIGCLVLSVIVARVTPVEKPVQTARVWTLYSFVFTASAVAVFLAFALSNLPPTDEHRLACRLAAGMVGGLAVSCLYRSRRTRRLRAAA